MAGLATAYASAGSTVTIYSDTECKHQVQVLHFSSANTYQCLEFADQTAQSVIFSNVPNDMNFNAWDSDYCAGDQAGGYHTTLSSWRPRNDS
jgi:hypothetical protein